MSLKFRKKIVFFPFNIYFFLSISRKAVKAAIILLPLLGITNFVVMTDPPTHDVTTFGFWSYTTFFLVSFQGFFISLLYCFLNGEVCIHIFVYIFVQQLQAKKKQKTKNKQIGQILWQLLRIYFLNQCLYTYTSSLFHCEQLKTIYFISTGKRWR